MIKNYANKKHLKIVIFILYGLLILLTLYHIVYAKRIIPGVYIGNMYLGGMTFVEAKTFLTTHVQNTDTTLRFTSDNIQYEFPASEIELSYDIDATVIRAFDVGRSGNPFIDTKDKLAGLVKSLHLNMFYTINDRALSNVFSTVVGETTVNPNEAAYVYIDGVVTVQPTQDGVSVDDEVLYARSVSALNTLNFETISIPMETKRPKIATEEYTKYLDKVQYRITNPLTIEHDGRLWTLTPEQTLSILIVKTKDNNSRETELALNSQTFEGFITELALEINELPRGHVTDEVDGKVTGFELVEEGLELNEKEFTEVFKTAFFGTASKVTIPVRILAGTSDPKKYGIVELLGVGESSYAGSASARIHNLSLAAERTDGVLVAPGETYSFNESVGAISSATGYATAYVISQGRTVLGDGGGVCQTSTTMFRAALNAGLPIITRHPHDYRVTYYEQDAKPGFDASIYQPSLDFKFKNDTSQYVLIQLEHLKSESKLRFKVYGTSDGREVEITDALVSQEIAPPAPRYVDDPSLPKGTTKQVDFAAWGATASFDRTVTRGDEVLYKDTFTTRYRPWQAVFLVGTKD